MRALAACGVLAVVLVAASWSSLRAVQAQVDETLLGFGSRTMLYPGASTGESRAVEVNGVRISMRTQVLEASLEQVLSHYERVCAGSHSAPATRRPWLASLATRTRRTSRDGYVACIDLAARDIPSLVRRASSFAKSWDLADIGSLRYAYARRTDDRESDRTHLVTIWSDESLDLHRLIPLGAGDAVGQDPTDLDRPARSQRLLSAREESNASAVYIYRVTASSAAQLAAAHRRMLTRRGWRLIERHPGESVAIDGVRFLAAEKGSRMASAIIQPEEAESSWLTLLTSGSE